MIQRSVFFFSLLLICAAVFARPSHDFHASIAEVKYNPQSRSFEVGVRFFTDDLAAMLSKQEGKPIRIDKNPNTESLIARYTMEQFQLQGKSGNPLLSNYIGFENEGELTWVYLEIQAGNHNLDNLKVRYTILYNHFSDQVNTVNVFINNKVSTLVFRADEQTEVQPVVFPEKN